MGSCHRLTPGFKPVDCKTYNLSPQEQEKLKEFIDENFAPVEFALHHPLWLHHFSLSRRKTDRYAQHRLPKVKRRHNQNRYPLPLISELIDKLGNAKSFQKWTYDGATITFVSRKMTNGKQPSEQI